MNNNELKKMANDMRKSAKGWETIGKWFLVMTLIFSIILTIGIASLVIYGFNDSKSSIPSKHLSPIEFSRGTGMDYSNLDSRYDDGDILIGEENGYYIYEGKGGTYKILK